MTSLQPIQLQILRILLVPKEAIEVILDKIKGNYGDKTDYSLRDNLRDYLKLEEDMFERSIQKLKNSGLFTTESRQTNWASGSYPNHLLDEAKNSMSTEANSLLTEFGKRFIKFIMRDL